MEMGIFSGVDTSSGRRGGRYIAPGKYELEISELKTIQSQKNAGTEFFVAEMLVKSASEETGYQVGDSVSWTANSNHPSAADNITSFFTAALNAGAGDITAAVCQDACGAGQPLRGMVVRASAYTVKTKSGGDFTVVDWSHGS